MRNVTIFEVRNDLYLIENNPDIDYSNEPPAAVNILCNCLTIRAGAVCAS